MCEYCKKEKSLLKGEIEKFNDIYLFMKKDEETLSVKTIKEGFEKEEIKVFIDRDYLRLTQGEDIGCIDHSIDIMKANFCLNCGEKIIV